MLWDSHGGYIDNWLLACPPTLQIHLHSNDLVPFEKRFVMHCVCHKHYHHKEPLGDKAQNMLQVLNRRAQIEDELTKLQITRPIEDSLFVEPMPIAASVQKNNTVTATKKEIPVNKPIIKKPIGDSVFKTSAPVKTNSLFTFDANANHSVAVVLNKVDIVFVNEARNAFTIYSKQYISP
jgi:hypothetical protein